MHYDEKHDIGRFINCTLLAIAILWVVMSAQLIRDAASILFR